MQVKKFSWYWLYCNFKKKKPLKKLCCILRLFKITTNNPQTLSCKDPLQSDQQNKPLYFMSVCVCVCVCVCVVGVGVGGSINKKKKRKKKEEETFQNTYSRFLSGLAMAAAVGSSWSSSVAATGTSESFPLSFPCQKNAVLVHVWNSECKSMKELLPEKSKTRNYTLTAQYNLHTQTLCQKVFKSGHC